MTDIASAPLVICPPDDFLQQHPHVRRLSNQLAWKYLYRSVVEDRDLQLIGEQLWRALDIGHDFDQAVLDSRSAILPLVIESQISEILSLPWETLYHPDHGHLGIEEAFTLSRKWPTEPKTLKLRKGPLKVLLFHSLPEDLDPEKERLNVEAEREGMLEGLSPLIDEGIATLSNPDEGSFEAFKHALREQEPHIVVLSGHGHYVSHTASNEQPRAYFTFEDEQGNSNHVEARDVAAAFIGRNVQCVLLNACQTGKAQSAMLNTSMAGRLMEKGIPFVIGMQESIFDVAGTQFSQALCKAVGSRERIDVAIQRARQAIRNPFKKGALLRSVAELAPTELSYGQWCLPTLFHQDIRHALLNWEQFEPTRPTRLFMTANLNGISLPERFIGRRKEVRELGALLGTKEVSIVVITGFGGQGKTSLAGTLMQRLVANGAQMYAFSARDTVGWDEFILQLKFQLDKDTLEKLDAAWWNPQVDDRTKYRLLLQLLLQYSQGRSLVFFIDNLESLQDESSGEIAHSKISTWLEICHDLAKEGVHVVITTRRMIPSLKEKARHYSLSQASYGDFLRYAIDLSVRNPTPQHSRRLYRALGGNFKGLQLFSCVEKVQGNEEGFLTAVEQAQEGLSLHSAVEAILNRLTAKERLLLNRLSVFKTPVIEAGVQMLCLDFEDWIPVLDRLVDLSLVELSKDRFLNSIQFLVSPLISELLVKDSEVLDQKTLKQAAAYQQYVLQYLKPTIEQAVVVHRAHIDAGNRDLACDLVKDVVFGYFYGRAMYRTLAEKWLPPLLESSRHKTWAYNSLGIVWYQLGEYSKAEPLFIQALEMGRKLLGNEHPDVATSLNNLAQLYQSQGRYEEAEPYLVQALEMSCRLLGSEHPAVAKSLNNLAALYESQGRYEEAEPLYVQALEMGRKLLGYEHPNVATSLNNLAQLYRGQGRYEEAEPLYVQALEIRRKLLGNEHPDVATSLNNLAVLYESQGRCEEAEPYLVQALEMSRKLLGSEHPDVALSLNNLAGLYQSQGRYEEAEPYLVKALEMWRKLLGLEHPYVATSLNNLGQLYQSQGRYEEAEPYLVKALEMRRKLLGSEHPDVALILNNLGQLYQSQGRYEEAEPYLVKALEMFKKLYGVRHPNTNIARSNFEIFLREKEKKSS